MAELGLNAFQLKGAEYTRLQEDVNLINKDILQGKTRAQNLDKDDFLKILITQLSHQDPTKPMEDKEFIAQMAQFSSLEQMTNMSTSFQEMSARMNQNQAFTFLGRSVEYFNGEQQETGSVEAITSGDYPQLLVNGKYIDMNDVIQVREE